MDTKAAFEKWWKERYGYELRWEAALSGYRYKNENAAWWAWKESRAAIEIELPEEKPYKHNSYPEARAQDDGFNDALSECSTIITSHGIRIKGKI